MELFPDPRNSTPEGIVAIGGQCDADTLKQAYKKGIFPWPQPGYPMIWFSPDPRGVLDFKELHIPKSLSKWAKDHKHWEYTENKAFSEVIEECSKQKRPGQSGTWILPEMVQGYKDLHEQGMVLSIECWEREKLIGGIYGVLTKKYFSAESMFFKKSNASKMCLWMLIKNLQKRGFTWMDIQMVTPVTKSLGGKLITREEFLGRISK